MTGLRIRGVARVAPLALLSTLAFAPMPASADIAFPQWRSVIQGRAGDAWQARVIRDKISGARALDDTALAMRRVRRKNAVGKLVVRQQAIPNVVRPARLAAGTDLGNSYIAWSKQAPDTVYAATELLDLPRRAATAVYFELSQGEHWNDAGRVKRVIANGDLRARVLFRGNRPLIFQLWRVEPSGMKSVIRYRFRRDGCAGTARTALVCTSTLANGGPIPTPRTSAMPNGKRVRVPAPKQFIELGVNLARFTGKYNPDPARMNSLVVTTTHDIAMGVLDPSATIRSQGGAR